MGDGWGSFLIGMAFSIHSSAALDTISRELQPTGVRGQINRSIVVSLFLFLLLYLPIGWLLSRVASPQIVAEDTPPFRNGDVVWVNRSAFNKSSPRPGQVVLYWTPEQTQVIPTEVHGTAYFYAGERIDRIVAVPGDRVRWEKRVLYVNDRPSMLQPLNPQALPEKLNIPSPA